MTQTGQEAALRALPSIDQMLTSGLFIEIEERWGRAAAVRIAREAVAAVRTKLKDGEVGADAAELVFATAQSMLRREASRGVRRVINATGVIVHTNLGRSALSDEAVRAIAENSRYCTVEFDLGSGKRGRRGENSESLVCDLTGAEAAVIVNNCAAAAFLALKVLAAGKEVVISRGELVEIGGDFRIPDVLSESGAVLREVGTTNRTKLADYSRAIGGGTGAILRVHPSNFRVIGFTASPERSELAGLAASHRIPLIEDAGSGALVDLSELGLGEEPVIEQSVAEGSDVVLFSGDKLFGGVQAGFIVGKAIYVDKIRRHPLYRALRVDKLAYAAIEATLRSYARGKHLEEIPTLRMLSIAEAEIAQRARSWITTVGETPGMRLELAGGESAVGGGSAPDVQPKTWLISVEVNGKSPDDLAELLRQRAVPVIGRIADGKLLIDLRTVFVDEETELANAIRELAA